MWKCSSREGESLLLDQISCAEISYRFSPLQGFMDQTTYESVVNTMRLPEQQLFGLPIVLDTDNNDLAVGQNILLRFNGKVNSCKHCETILRSGILFQDLAVLEIESKWVADKPHDAEKLYTTSSEEHPTVYDLYHNTGKYYLGGKVHGLSLFYNEGNSQFQTPVQVRSTIAEVGFAFVTPFSCCSRVSFRSPLAMVARL